MKKLAPWLSVLLWLVVACGGTPLTVTIQSPTENALTTEKLKIEGNVSQSDVKVTYSLNGAPAQDVALSGDTFSFEVTASNGTNNVKVAAVKEGESAEDTVSFIVTTPVPESSPLVVQNDLAGTEKTFVRPAAGGKGLEEVDVTVEARTVFYDVVAFSVPKTDFYTISSVQNFDAYLILYKDAFTPDTPEKNIIGFNDGPIDEDDAGNLVGTSDFIVSLQPNTAYFLVTTSYAGKTVEELALGNYEHTVKGGAPAIAPPSTLPAPNPNGFDITVRFVDDTLTKEQQAVFTKAAAVWSQVITQDVQDIPNFFLPASYSFLPAPPLSGTVDDVIIDVSSVNVEASFLAAAGPSLLRDKTVGNTNVPVFGTMIINLFFADTDLADPVVFEDTIVHEMGHVLGIGTTWETTTNLQGVEEEPVPVDLGVPNPAYDPRFVGKNAVTAYKEILAASGRPTEDSVPVENTGGGGSIDSHWREFLFNDELMSSSAEPTNEPLSKLTAASLIDIGYTVNLNSAAVEPYTIPAAPEPATFKQLAPTATTYEDFVDFVRVDGAEGAITGLVQGVDLFIDESASATDPASKNPANSTSGCEASDFTGFTSGRIALIQRGTCAFDDKVANAQTAGAAGIILFNQGNTPARRGLFAPGVEGATVPVIAIPFDLAKQLSSASGLRVEINVPVPPALTAQRANQLDITSREILLRPVGTVSVNGSIQLDAGYSNQNLRDEIEAQLNEQVQKMMPFADR